ncbi:MAG: hypothetical protein H0V00_13670 [Chloroflexia bacterium]|nr:hypothetical protein [Chloroflexia bacterium]
MRFRVVNEDKIRKLFNDGRYYERMRAGEFQARIVRPILIRRGDRRIRNTMNQTVEYWDTFGNFIARAHQFRRHDGSLGASGRPDPKDLRHNDVPYRLDMSEDWDLCKD